MDAAKRFAIVTETYPPEVNGVARTVHGLQTGLQRLGHEVSLVRPRQPQDSSEAAHLLVAGAGLPRYAGLRFGFPAGRRLAATWRARRPDAIYVATEGPLGWSALRCAARLRIPVATGFHTRFDHYAASYGAGLLAPLVLAWLRRFHNQSQLTLAPTRELADWLRGRGFARVEVLARAVDTGLFTPERRCASLRRCWGLVDGQLAVIHVGRLAPEKNLALAVRAFRAIERQVPGARFVLVGDGPARAALQAAHPDFVFAGVQLGAALGAHYASADLFLFPSRSETFGNVTLEAMASGVAPVAFDYAAAREYLRDGVHGASVPLDDAAGFVRAAVALASDPQQRRRCADAARARVAELSPESVHRAFAASLARLIPQGAA